MSQERSLAVQPGKSYIFIDYIYVQDFCEFDFSNQDLSDLKILFTSLRTVVFDSSYNPYALYEAESNEFDLSSISPIEAEEIDVNRVNIRQFCSDTGLILVIDLNVFLDFISIFDDVRMFESIEGISDTSYWLNLKNKYPKSLYYFYTEDVDNHSAGGGNFEIF